jgi:hypothetical protein
MAYATLQPLPVVEIPIGATVYWGRRYQGMYNLILGMYLGNYRVKWTWIKGNTSTENMIDRMDSVHTNPCSAFLDVMGNNPHIGGDL